MHESITMDLVIELCEADDNEGICLACGEIASGVEPDAEGYECEACGAHAVDGAHNLLMSIA